MMRWQWYRGVTLGAILALAPLAEAQVRPPPLPPSELVILVSDTTSSSEGHGSTGLTPTSVGPVTGRPLPRFASLRNDEGEARRGPSLEEPVDWVLVRETMPLLITDESGEWRRVVEQNGQGGWVRFIHLSGTRTAIVEQDRLTLRSRPEEDGPEVALLEQDVIVQVETCEPDWCRISSGGYGGWAPKAALWGVGAEEVLE